jgi:hypothetical protein
MRSAFGAILGRLNLTLLGLTMLVATFWFTDHLTNRQPVAPPIDQAAVLAKRLSQPRRPGVFIYIIDSLRYETATNPAIMPNLCALRAEGAQARITPRFNSVTGPALRDLFTGRENAAVLAPVATFLHNDAGVESLFHQMALQGLTTAAYSDGFFRQFGAGVAKLDEQLGRTSTHAAQEAHVLAAVDALRNGEFDLTIGHLPYTDSTAHQEGVGTPVYRAAFSAADALIPVIRSRLPPDATLVITGDHGHDLRGRHGTGLDVPTISLYVGPRFRRGVDLGPTPIMSNRYLLSHALGLPVTNEAYAGDRLTAAIVWSPGEIPDAGPSGLTARAGGSWLGWFVWLYFSFIAAVWFNLVCRGSSPCNFSGGRAGVLWLATAPLLVSGGLQSTAALLAAGAVLLTVAGRMSASQFLLWLVLPTACGLACVGWGHVLKSARPWLENLPLAALAAYWIVVAGLGAALANRRRRTALMAVVFAAPALLFHPVYHHYGFPGTLAPLVACWFVFYARSLLRDGALAAPGARLKLLLLATGLFFLLQPFAAVMLQAAGGPGTFSTGPFSGTFGRWHALIAGWNVGNFAYLVPVSLGAKGVIFFSRRPGRPALALGVVLIAFLQVVECRWWVPGFDLRLALTLMLLAGWAAAARAGHPEARLFGLGALFLLYFSLVALTPRNFVETSLMMGGVALCAQVVRWFPQTENVRADYLVLALFGLMVTGWAGMRWSALHLEWHAMYEWASAATVERYVGWFIPWIALKGLLPWAIVLVVLHDRLGALAALPARALMIVFCAKLLALLMLTIGLAGTDAFNLNYLETACVVAVLTMLYLGVVLLPHSWSRVTPSPLTGLPASR